jgi:hypothetical protein
MTKVKKSLVVDDNPDLAKVRQRARSRARVLTADVKLEDTPNYTLDTVYASSIAVNSARRAAQFKELLSQLVTFDYKSVDELDLLGQALMDIQGELNNCSKTEAALTQHANDGYAVRSLLLTYADLLAMVGTVDGNTVAKIREGAGYKDLVEDLESLNKLYEDCKLPEEGPVTKQTVDRAAELSVILGKELTLKDESDAKLAGLLAERRQIAYLLIKTHREVRRAILFLREPYGDVEEIIPSLYATGAGRPSKDKSTDDTPAAQAQPTQAQPAQPQPAPTKPAQVTQVGKTTEGAPVPAMNAGFTGNPNDNPFDDLP